MRQEESTREEAQLVASSTELHAMDWEHQAQSLHVQAALEREQRQRLDRELGERRQRHDALADELSEAKAQLRQLKHVAEGTAVSTPTGIDSPSSAVTPRGCSSAVERSALQLVRLGLCRIERVAARTE